MSKEINFTLLTPLGMKVLEKCVVGEVHAGGQAMQLGVKKGWSITAIKEGSGRTTAVTSLGALQAALARCKADSGHAWCTLTFSPKPVPPVAPLPTTPLPLAVQQGALAAGAWFLLKAAVGNKAHEWLGSVLAFSFCAVVATTVGFDVAVFLAGSTFIVLTLRIIEMFMGHGVYDLVVLGLIAAYHTKPAVKSFDGRPMREMLALRQELKQRARPPARQPSGLDGLIGQVVAGGKQLVKEMVADVSDAAVPVAFTDCHVFVLAEAKFNARGERRGDNVFYVGAFSRWFNVNAQLTAAVLALDAKLRAVAARPPPPRR